MQVGVSALMLASASVLAFALVGPEVPLAQAMTNGIKKKYLNVSVSFKSIVAVETGNQRGYILLNYSYRVAAFLTASSSDISAKFAALRKRPFLPPSTKAPTATPGMLLSGAFGAWGPPKSVRHHPGSVKLINTPVPSSLVPKSVVNLSRAALLAEYPACSGLFLSR